MSEPYSDIYALKPVREVEPGWWKLRWRPLWKKTFAIFRLNSRSTYGLGVYCWTDGVHNGWGRSYDRLQIRIMFVNQEFWFWIKWNYVVKAEGPLDMHPPRPLDLSGVE